MEVVIRQGAGALLGQIRLQPVRLTEQLQRLIEDMGAEIKPEAGARATRFAPALTHLGTIAIKVGFELGNLAERPLSQQAAYGEKVPVPAPVVEDAEQSLLLLRQLDQRLRLDQIQGERLVDHYVLASQQRLAGDGGMGVVGSGDHHQVDGLIA